MLPHWTDHPTPLGSDPSASSVHLTSRARVCEEDQLHVHGGPGSNGSSRWLSHGSDPRWGYTKGSGGLAGQPGGGDEGEERVERASAIVGGASAGLGSAHRQRFLASLAQLIRDIVSDFPYLAMDTEFPGVVARPVGNFKNSGEYHYQTLRCVILGGVGTLRRGACA